LKAKVDSGCKNNNLKNMKNAHERTPSLPPEKANLAAIKYGGRGSLVEFLETGGSYESGGRYPRAIQNADGSITVEDGITYGSGTIWRVKDGKWERIADTDSPENKI